MLRIKQIISANNVKVLVTDFSLQECRAHQGIVLKVVTSRFALLDKVSLNSSGSSFVMRDHPCSVNVFLIYLWCFQFPILVNY